MAKQVIRYSESFKMQVISELESGKLKNISEANRKYGIKGAETVKRWLKKYGKNHLVSKVVKVETPEDIDEKKALKKRIAELEKALADTSVKAVINEAYFQVVCEKFGVTDFEGMKKKLDVKLSQKDEK